MTATRIIPKLSSTKNILTKLASEGFAHIPASYYLSGQRRAPLKQLQHTYTLLSKDTASDGNRYRAYSRYLLDPETNSLELAKSNDYFQPKDYNETDGDKIRRFDFISDAFLNNPIVKHVLGKNLEFAKQSNLIEATNDLEVGLHQIRYLARRYQPAFSSPSWLHRDSEPLVFVHLMNMSRNLIGGDNVMAANASSFIDVFRLNDPLDALVVNRNEMHAVTPMGSADDEAAFRDVLLITFENESKKVQKNKRDRKSVPANTGFFATAKKAPESNQAVQQGEQSICIPTMKS